MEKSLAERAEEARLERKKIRDEEMEKSLAEMVAAIKGIFPEAEYVGQAEFKIEGHTFIGCDREKWPRESESDSRYYLSPRSYEPYYNTPRPIFDLADYGDFLKTKKEFQKNLVRKPLGNEMPRFPENETEDGKPVRPANIVIEEKGCLAMILNLFK